jgi:hypothetical protein
MAQKWHGFYSVKYIWASVSSEEELCLGCSLQSPPGAYLCYDVTGKGRMMNLDSKRTTKMNMEKRYQETLLRRSEEISSRKDNIVAVTIVLTGLNATDKMLETKK